MNEQGGTKALDISGRSNTGALTNAPVWDNQALNFAVASDQYVNLGNPTALQITGSITISAWFWLLSGAAAASRQLVTKDKNTGGRAFTLDVYTTSPIIRFYVNGGAGSDIINGATVLALKRWYHAAATYNATGKLMDLYLNGKRDESAGQITATSAIPSAAANVLIGRREYAGFTEAFDGKIRNVRIYNRALSQQEIWDLYVNPYAGLRVPRRRNITGQPSVGGFFAKVRPLGMAHGISLGMRQS